MESEQTHKDGPKEDAQASASNSQMSPLRELLSQYEPIYLATPYTKVPDGLEKAYERSCNLAGRLIKHGLIVYCPIAHCHPIAEHGEINPVDTALWAQQCEGMMKVCGMLLVAKLPWWADNVGIRREIEWFKAQRPKRPRLFINPGTLEVTRA